jgi:hypothetical protein
MLCRIPSRYGEIGTSFFSVARAMRTPSEDYASMTTGELDARRDAMLEEAARLIGKFIFVYSRFITCLHLCVAWREDAKHFDAHVAKSEDLGAADLLKTIESQAHLKLDDKPDALVLLCHKIIILIDPHRDDDER